MLGQFAAVASMWLAASRMPSTVGGKVSARRVIDRIHPERPAADLPAQRVDELPADAADTGRFTGAAGEHHLDVGAWIGIRRWDGRAEQRRSGRHRPGSDGRRDPAYPIFGQLQASIATHSCLIIGVLYWYSMLITVGIAGRLILNRMERRLGADSNHPKGRCAVGPQFNRESVSVQCPSKRAGPRDLRATWCRGKVPRRDIVVVRQQRGSDEPLL